MKRVITFRDPQCKYLNVHPKIDRAFAEIGQSEREVQYDHSILKIAYIRIEYKIVTNCTTDNIIGQK